MAGQKGQRGVPRRSNFAPRSTQPYQDTPLAALGTSPNGIAWLSALDAIIPPTPLTYAALFEVIGPPGNPTAQNQRVAQLLGYDITTPGGRSAGLRAVQRYRRSEVEGANPRDVRGQSAQTRAALLNDLAPTARGLILRRFMALTKRDGLFGHFAGWIAISDKPRFYDRDGGVDGAHMAAIVTRAAADDWEDAANDYFSEWLADWGSFGYDSDPEFLAFVDELVRVVVGPDGAEPQWTLRLGYPDDAGLAVDSPELAKLMTDESLATLRDL